MDTIYRSNEKWTNNTHIFIHSTGEEMLVLGHDDQAADLDLGAIYSTKTRAAKLLKQHLQSESSS